MGDTMSWKKTIGRVAFLNCDPLFHSVRKEWRILSAPPSWLTGHILRRDCILAPIPAADYARHRDELILLPNIGICSKGEVGSVLLFSKKSIDQVNTVALPSDSATSVVLCQYLLKMKGYHPTYTQMGPDIDSMIQQCDAALLIGDRALQATKEKKYNVILDLGEAWFTQTSQPMVFGVFAARKDTPLVDLEAAYTTLLDNLVEFETQPTTRQNVIRSSSKHSQLPVERLEQYFGEVFNRLDDEHISGLNTFLQTVFSDQIQAEFISFGEKRVLLEQTI